MKDTDKKTDEKPDEVLSTYVDDFSEQEFSDMVDFIDRIDAHKHEYLFIISRDKNFDQAEVIMLFKDELFLRQRFKNQATVHNENLGMESELEYIWDSSVSIRREDIGAVEVSRPPMCDCNSCSTKREKGAVPEQPEHYELTIVTSSKQYKIKVDCMEDGFGIKKLIRGWMFKKRIKK